MLTVRQRYGQTDGRTDGRLTIAIPRFALRASRGKKGKGRVLAAALLTRELVSRDQKRFTISEVAVDWHELMIPRRIMRPSIARAIGNIGPAVQHTDIPPPQSATLGLQPVLRKLLLISHPAKGRRLS